MEVSEQFGWYRMPGGVKHMRYAILPETKR